MAGEKAAGEDAAGKQVEADRLLAGEDPETHYLDDAVHWLAVYRELLQGKATILTGLTERLAQMHEDEARHELGETDVVVLQHETARIQSRIDFWTKRRGELEGEEAGRSQQT